MATAYVTNSLSNTVSVISTLSNRVIATIPVGERPGDMAITPNRRRVYVTNRFSNTVSVIGTQSNRVIATIPTGRGPSRIEFIPNRLPKSSIKRRKSTSRLSRPLIKRRKGLYSIFKK